MLVTTKPDLGMEKTNNFSDNFAGPLLPSRVTHAPGKFLGNAAVIEEFAWTINHFVRAPNTQRGGRSLASYAQSSKIGDGIQRKFTFMRLFKVSNSVTFDTLLWHVLTRVEHWVVPLLPLDDARVYDTSVTPSTW